MDELLQKLAEGVGISPETARGGVGAVLSFLKEKLPDGMFGHVEDSVPEADGMVKAFEAKNGSSGGGLISAVTGMAGKLLGGSGADAARLIEMLAKSGLSMSQVASFLPKVLDFLRPYLPPEVLEKVSELIGSAIAKTPSEGV